jgi:hypothetical protein
MTGFRRLLIAVAGSGLLSLTPQLQREQGFHPRIRPARPLSQLPPAPARATSRASSPMLQRGIP